MLEATKTRVPMHRTRRAAVSRASTMRMGPCILLFLLRRRSEAIALGSTDQSTYHPRHLSPLNHAHVHDIESRESTRCQRWAQRIHILERIRPRHALERRGKRHRFSCTRIVSPGPYTIGGRSDHSCRRRSGVHQVASATDCEGTKGTHDERDWMRKTSFF